MKSIRPYLLTIAALSIFALVAHATDTFVQGQHVQITDTNQSNVVTTTPVSFKRGLDVNCISGCSSGGGSDAGVSVTVVVIFDGGPVTQGLSNDGGFNWHVDVGQWGGQATSLGQKTSANSVPVVIASDQSSVNVSASQSGTWTVQQGTPPWSFNQTQINGVAVSTGNGIAGTGVQRVTIASDNTPFTVNVSFDGGSMLVTQGLSNDGGFDWHTDVARFGGNPVVTGTGASGAGIPRVTVANDSNVLATQSGTWTVQQGTPPWSVVGTKTNNSAAPGATNIGALPAVSTAAAPTYTEGNLVALSVDNAGNLRTTASVSSVNQGLSNDGGFNWHTDVAQWGGVSTTLGQKVSASSVPVVIASDQSTVPVSLAANQSVNLAQVNGTTTSTGNGIAGTGTQRVTIASDNTAFSVNAAQSGAWTVAATQSGAWNVNNTQVGTASQNVAQFGGTNVSTGTGASGAGIPRVTVSNDSNVLATQSGTWTVNSHTQDNSGNGIESAITEVVGTNRGLLVRNVDKTLTAPVITAVSCGTTATALPTTAGRKTICIENEGAGDIFIGPAGVTTATGFPIGVNGSWCDDVGSQAYFCINASGTNDVRVLEN
jgi:hypothetical protein